MASSSRSRCSEDSHELSPQYNRILMQSHSSRVLARLSTDHYKMTLVGSVASGVDMSGSDTDILIEPRNIIINESSLRYRPDVPCYVRISTEGLAGLVPNVILGDGKYVLADPVRDMCEEIFGETNVAHALSKVGKIFESRDITTDLVPQLRISKIPQTARLFSTRDRSWPSDDIISLIICGEFHLAARPAPSDPDCEHDFCLSFAKAEVVLFRSMSVNQILSIKLLKGIGRVIDFGRGVLTSYHLKTSALWYFEQTKSRFWENDLSTVDILKRLDQDLNIGFLPHYFVPEMNLLTGVLESDLIYLRRRLWSLLGLYLITGDIEGMKSRTTLELAVFVFNNLSILSETIPAITQTGHTSHIRDTIEAAEVMYGTGIVSHVTKQRVSASLMARCPIHQVRRLYIDKVKSKLTSFHKAVYLWMYSRKHKEDFSFDTFVLIMYVTVDSNKDPLEEFFVITSTGKNKGAVVLSEEHCENQKKIMNKWLVFVDDTIIKLQRYGNIIADQVSRDISNKLRGDSGNRCQENIDKLLYKIIKELLTFAVDHIETFSYPLDNNDTYLFKPVPVGDYHDFRANLHILEDVFERLFLNVDYALVTSARIMASGGSGDQNGIRLARTMKPESLEYRCVLAWIVFKGLLREFYRLCSVSSEHQGWVEFMAATFRRKHC